VQTDERTSRYTKQGAQEVFEWAKEIAEFLSPVFFQKPSIWVQENLDLTEDNSSNADGLVDLSLTPYVIEPLDYLAREIRKKLTVMAVEQTGKSSVWKFFLPFLMEHIPMPAGIIYQNEDIGVDINRDSVLPLLNSVERLRLAMQRPNSKNARRYAINGTNCYFMGGDGAIISRPLGFIVGDEVDFWRSEKASRRNNAYLKDASRNVSAIKDMDKRLRTFPTASRVLVCSPTTKFGPINQEFLLGSESYWHLRCQKCGDLTILSCNTDVLKYEMSSEVLLPDTIRLECPECKHLHEECDKREMNVNGGYIHAHPERYNSHFSVQWGALASQFPGTDWTFIVESKLTSEDDNAIEPQKFFWNSVKGLPYEPKIITGKKLDVLRTHCGPEPAPDDIEAIFMAVDTQDAGYWYIVRAVDSDENTYLLDRGQAYENEDLDVVWNRTYYGLYCAAGMIDEGGHRKDDVNDFIEDKPAFFKYKGDGRIQKGNYKLSDNVDEPRLILAKARYYQSQLLYQMYAQDRQANNYWYLPHSINRDYLKQLASFQPDPAVEDCDFENWVHEGRQHDLFDCEKMWFTLFDFAKKELPPSIFKRGKGRWLKKKKGDNEPPPVVKRKSKWVNKHR